MWWLLLLHIATSSEIIFNVNNHEQYDITYTNIFNTIVTHYDNPEINICAGTYQVKSTSISHPLYFAGVPVDTEFVTIHLNGFNTYACRNHPTMSNNINVQNCSTSEMDEICEQACPMCDIGYCDFCGSCTCNSCVAASTAPTTAPATEAPTEAPTETPTEAPTEEPTTQAPTTAPATEEPTAPTEEPTAPTEAPTEEPTTAPATEAPTAPATEAPTEAPTEEPTAPTEEPTEAPTTQAPDCGCSSCNCNDWSEYTNKKECLDETCPDCYTCTHPECEVCSDCDCFDTSPYGLFKCQQCMVSETSCSTCNIDLYNLSLPDCDCSDCPWDTIETCSYEDDYATCADNEDGNCRPCFECHGLIPATTAPTTAPPAPTTQAPTTQAPTAPTAPPVPADAYPYGIIDIMLCPNDPDITLVWTGYHNIKRIVDDQFVEETLSDFLNEGAVRTLKAATLSDWGATTKWGCSLHPTGRITTTCITVLPTFTAQEETIATSTIVGGGAVALMLVGMGIMALA